MSFRLGSETSAAHVYYLVLSALIRKLCDMRDIPCSFSHRSGEMTLHVSETIRLVDETTVNRAKHIVRVNLRNMVNICRKLRSALAQGDLPPGIDPL